VGLLRRLAFHGWTPIVAEIQRRGVVHFHAFLRLDGANPYNPAEVLPAPAGVELTDLVGADRKRGRHYGRRPLEQRQAVRLRMRQKASAAHATASPTKMPASSSWKVPKRWYGWVQS
jgi:Replication initiator protein, pSAM2